MHAKLKGHRPLRLIQQGDILKLGGVSKRLIYKGPWFLPYRYNKFEYKDLGNGRHSYFDIKKRSMFKGISK